jgi:uncharacterized membrane protein YfcA
MIHDPWFYALAVPAVLMTGISKGGFAGGIGLMAVPMLALVIDPVRAAGILLPILVAMDLFGIGAYRRTFDKRNLKQLVPGAILGIGFGALTAGLVTETDVKLIVGVIATSFALYFFWPRSAERPPSRGGWLSGTLCGIGAGFTSFVAHAGTPPFQIHMLPQRLDKTLYVGTSIMFFATLNFVKLLPYGLLGELAPGNLETSLVLLPLAPLGMFIGIKLHHVIPEKPFYRLCYTMVLIVGLKLLWDGATAIV